MKGMDPLAKFVQGQNIARFTAQLLTEADANERDVLRQLLLEEETRYGFRSEQLALADQHIAASALRIERQKMLIEQMKAKGADTKIAERIFGNFLETHQLFVEIRSHIAEGLDRGTI